VFTPGSFGFLEIGSFMRLFQIPSVGLDVCILSGEQVLKLAQILELIE
jgi:hypothetical protein